MSLQTLLGTANVVFRAIGERPVLTLSTTQGDRVKDCLKQACLDTETLHTWDWLYKRITATSWALNVAALPTYQRLFNVSIGDPIKGYKKLTNIPEYQLDELPIKGYTGTKDLASMYAITNGGAKFNNYPTDLTAQGRIIFYIQEPIKVPTFDNDVFENIPERYMPLIEKKACYLMCIRYLDDAQAGSYFQQEFEQLVQNFRAMERRTPVGKSTMYRGGR
jgi:hypothetical protein